MSTLSFEHNQAVTQYLGSLGNTSNDLAITGQCGTRKTLVQTRQKYRSIVRSCLNVDTFSKGEPVGPYDILDDNGVAYILKESGVEVKVEVFEGKQAFVPMFRIASFPRVREEDTFYMESDPVRYAINASFDAIYEQEDFKFFLLLAETQRDYSEWTREHPELTEPSYLNYPHSKRGVRNVIAEIKNNFLEPTVIITNPVNEADLKNWSAYANIEVRTAALCPEDQSFVLPSVGYIGVMPTYGIQVKDNPLSEQFWEGKVLNELVGMAVLNSRAVGVLEGR